MLFPSYVTGWLAVMSDECHERPFYAARDMASAANAEE